MNNKTSTFEHIQSIIQLPFVVTILIPSAIYYFTRNKAIIPLNKIPALVCFVFGSISLIAGIILFSKSLSLFIKIGNGTLAPWNPTKKMIIQGLYRHVRNPMLIGVNFILLGEALLLQSGNIMIWMIVFIIINTIYFIKKEEPDLAKKFGEEYRDYCQHVPRWIPRLKPYQPEIQ